MEDEDRLGTFNDRIQTLMRIRRTLIGSDLPKFSRAVLDPYCNTLHDAPSCPLFYAL